MIRSSFLRNRCDLKYWPCRPFGPSHTARAAEAADQVGHGVVVLSDREPRQLDPRRPVPRLGRLRVERIIDVGRHLLWRPLPRTSRVVVGHRLGDVLGKLADRAVALQRVAVLLGALSLLAMARQALLLVNLLARSGYRRRPRHASSGRTAGTAAASRPGKRSGCPGGAVSSSWRNQPNVECRCQSRLYGRGPVQAGAGSLAQGLTCSTFLLPYCFDAGKYRPPGAMK